MIGYFTTGQILSRPIVLASTVQIRRPRFSCTSSDSPISTDAESRMGRFRPLRFENASRIRAKAPTAAIPLPAFPPFLATPPAAV